MIPTRFCTYLADCPDSETLHHHLRYKVYCERKQYESSGRTSDCTQEWDEYDGDAARFIVKDAVDDCWIGTARLVPNLGHLLPSQTLGAIDCDHCRILDAARSAEVSRLATVTSFSSIACSAELLQSVILGVLGHSREVGTEWLVFLVSRGLSRMLNRIDIPMEVCGPKVEHRGVRQAYLSNVAHAIEVIPWAGALRNGLSGYEAYSGGLQAAAA